LKKPKNILTVRRLENKFKPTSDLEFVYETPTQKYFKQLKTDKKYQEVIVAKKVNELFELESNLKQLAVQNRHLCSNCHTPGHNKPGVGLGHRPTLWPTFSFAFSPNIITFK
jgi:hypothetical protein